MKDIKKYINEAHSDLVEKSKIIKEINKRLKIVEDPQNNNVHTNRLKEVYTSLLDFIEEL